MVGDKEWVPRGIAPLTPNVARIYDYHLGGKDNYAADRAVSERMRQAFPLAPEVAKANRGFLEEVGAYCAQRGIRSTSTSVPASHCGESAPCPGDCPPTPGSSTSTTTRRVRHPKPCSRGTRRTAVIEADPEHGYILDIPVPGN